MAPVTPLTESPSQHRKARLGTSPTPSFEYQDDRVILPKSISSIVGKDILDVLRHDISQTTFPSWMKPAPRRFGSISFGKIGAEEWKTIATISAPITFIRLWWAPLKKDKSKEGSQPPTHGSSFEFYQYRRRSYLTNFLHLSLSMRLAQRRVVTEHTLGLYEQHILAYLEGFKLLFPNRGVTPYMHFSLHVPEVARRWGPYTIYDTNFSEFWNERLQTLNTNSKFCTYWRLGCSTALNALHSPVRAFHGS